MAAIKLIRKRREAAGLSQKRAAELAGIDREEWNKIENGRRGVGADYAARIANVLGGEPSDYLHTVPRGIVGDP